MRTYPAGILMLLIAVPCSASEPGRRDRETFPLSNPVFRPEDRQAFQMIWPIIPGKDRSVRHAGQAPPTERTPAGTARWRAAQADGIREVVLRQAMKAYAPVYREKTGLYYLQVDGKDPSRRLIQRFSRERLPVKPNSQAAPAELMGHKDPATGKRGKLFWVRDLRWLPDGRATLQGGYHWHGRAAAGATYTLVHRDGRWTITGTDGQWVS